MSNDDGDFIVSGRKRGRKDDGERDDPDDKPAPGSRGRTQMPGRPSAMSDAKRKKLADAADDFDAVSAPPGMAPAAQPSAPSLTEERDTHMFYPENYETFDEERLVCDSEPLKPKQGSGMMVFFGYIWPDGVQKPLLAQAPKMFLPGGVMRFEDKNDDGAVTKIRNVAMCSFGKEWESNPTMVRFRAFCGKIKSACAKLIFKKGLGAPFCTTVEQVEECFSDIVTESQMIDKQTNDIIGLYPPCIKLIVNTAPNNRTLLVSRLPPDPADPSKKRYAQIPLDSVAKGGSIIPMIHAQWVFRAKKKDVRAKTNPEFYLFNIHTSIYQAVIEAGGVGQMGADGKLSIVC